MPRKSAPTASTPAVTTSAPAPTSAKKARKPRATASKTAAAATPAPVPVVAEPVVEATPAAPSQVSVLQDEFAEFLGKLNQVSSQFASLRSDFRGLEKRWTRELRTAQKSIERRKRKVGNRAPSGFVKPTLISDELATFLGKDQGTEMARTEVTREINKYIRANALQDKDNGRKINPDAALTSLLKIGTEDELTYFNLQRYMSPHFAKLGQEIPAANIQ
ncbi:MAG: SWIB/MDM2 domain-containing protein [Vampirovibrionia bacterium]